MALANTLSGMVESTSGCVSEHALEHVLSAFQKDLPHGAGLIMLSVAYFTKIMEKGCSNDRLVDMAKALGLENASKPEDFITALKNLQIACGVENLKMSDYGIKPEDMTKFANIVKTDMIGNFRNDPCELTIADCEEIYTKSYK